MTSFNLLLRFDHAKSSKINVTFAMNLGAEFRDENKNQRRGFTQANFGVPTMKKNDPPNTPNNVKKKIDSGLLASQSKLFAFSVI